MPWNATTEMAARHMRIGALESLTAVGDDPVRWTRVTSRGRDVAFAVQRAPLSRASVYHKAQVLLQTFHRVLDLSH